MLLEPGAADIVAQWQIKTDLALEAGQEPTLFVARTESGFDALAGMAAYDAFVRTRTAPRTVTAIFAGASPLWLLALLMQPRDPKVPAPVVAHAGTDPATILAATTTFAASVLPATRGLLPPPAGLDLGQHEHLLPAEEPGNRVRWQALPFAIMDQAPPVVDGIDREFNWAGAVAIFLAVCLVLFALIF